jgi:hypothetical protein
MNATLRQVPLDEWTEWMGGGIWAGSQESTRMKTRSGRK